ncbi:MAG: hypothetical protein IM673_05695 [Phenylobacterium sp.]|uniref:hypothetical protein n=1 Tax=Phenylobacterium sp. TaxID=1871053 RepID=UPI0025F783E4|nr:hypothetical protein [Phenylobacterium sp.]MCA3716129.1 hypothetical protein [Phenylobacterium sp.]MCA3737543.1 hypothetical protein [Phenylobacterium sp.]
MLHVIFRDLRTNGLFWLASFASHGLFIATLIDAARFSENGLLGPADALALSVAIFALVQADSPSAYTADWRTRTITPAQIFAAKLISIFAIIILPKLLIGVFSAPYFTMTYAEATWAMGLRLLVDLALTSFAFAIAASSRSPSQAAIIFCSVVTSLVLALVASERLHVDPLWLPVGAAGASLAAGVGVVVLHTQLRKVVVRIGLLGAALLWPWLTLAIEALRWSEPVSRPPAETPGSASISVAPYAILLSYPEAKTFDFEYAFSGPKGTSVVQYRVSATRIGSTTQGVPQLGTFVDRGPFDIGARVWAELDARALPARETDRLRIDFDFGAFQALRSEPLPLGRSLRRINGLGSCVLKVHEKVHEKVPEKALYCLSSGIPPCFSTNHEDIQCWSRDPRAWIRWPSPYLVTGNSVYEPTITIWTDHGQFRRTLILSRAQVEALSYVGIPPPTWFWFRDLIKR